MLIQTRLRWLSDREERRLEDGRHLPVMLARSSKGLEISALCSAS